jgi:hypothetical protein
MKIKQSIETKMNSEIANILYYALKIFNWVPIIFLGCYFLL